MAFVAVAVAVPVALPVVVAVVVAVDGVVVVVVVVAVAGVVVAVVAVDVAVAVVVAVAVAVVVVVVVVVVVPRSLISRTHICRFGGFSDFNHPWIPIFKAGLGTEKFIWWCLSPRTVQSGGADNAAFKKTKPWAVIISLIDLYKNP